TFMPRSSARSVTCLWTAVRSSAAGQASSTPSTRWPRITTCSTSSTVSSCAESPEKSLEVTPGRSRPVSVTSRVVGGRDIALTTLPSAAAHWCPAPPAAVYGLPCGGPYEVPPPAAHGVEAVNSDCRASQLRRLARGCCIDRGICCRCHIDAQGGGD